MGALYAALVHYPVVDRGGNDVVASVTNLDIHDMSRTACTYGVRALFVVTPVEAQRQLVDRIRAHWLEGAGGERIPERKDALSVCRLVPALSDAIAEVEQAHGTRPALIATSAVRRPELRTARFVDLRRDLEAQAQPALLLFGTSHGLSGTVLADADHVLEPIVGPGPYNHLSVRSAFAIALDRLAGPRQ